MYVPKHFVLDDPEKIAEVLRSYNFALLLSALEGQAPVGTHLPFLFDAARGVKGTLIGHMARANPHARDIARLAEAGGEVLAIFSGPHAYISPSWFGPGDAVPTWNYVAIHVTGAPRMIDDPVAARAVVSEMAAVHESGRVNAYSVDDQDEKYIARMLRGIAVFEIPIARLEAKAKLSQNKGADNRQSMIDGLRAGGNPGDAALAKWMDALADVD